MSKKFITCLTLLTALTVAGCDGGVATPRTVIVGAGTSTQSANAVAFAGGVPDGVRISHLGDVVLLNGVHFAPDMRIFFGRNNSLYKERVADVSSLSLPRGPITEIVDGVRVVLEVETTYEYLGGSTLLVRIPPAVSCTDEYTDPYLRMTSGRNGSSDSVDNIFRIVGPRFIALTPNDGLDTGGYTVTVHGDWLSPYTQVAVRFVNPLTDQEETRGLTANDDIDETFVDRHTLIINNWPSVVADITEGLTEELKADIILYENIEEITSNPANEPLLEEDAEGRRGACPAVIDLHIDEDGNRDQRATSDAGPGYGGISFVGVRKAERNGAFTFQPSGVVDIPVILTIVPARGSEIGGNMVIVNGSQFDAFSVDISDDENLGIAIECPPGSGEFIAPLEATLIDRQTIVLKMPKCDVAFSPIPQLVDVCITNKFVLDRLDPDPAQSAINITNDSRNPLSNNLLDQDPQTYPNLVNNRHLVYDDLYTYEPIPPIAPPILTAIHPSNGKPQPNGLSADYGCQRLIMVGDWFDADTTLNGGVEFILNDGTVVQTQRTILHNRNLIEVFTKQLPDGQYPLLQDMEGVHVRLRNTVGHRDFNDAMTFFATPHNSDTPVFTEMFRDAGPTIGGNAVQIHGANFDTTTIAVFGGIAAETFFINSEFLIAIAPDAEQVFEADGDFDGGGSVGVIVDNDGNTSQDTLIYNYGSPADTCPAIGVNTPDAGSHIGGYSIQIFGTDFTSTTRVEFGVGNGNFSPDVFYISDTCILVEVPEAFPEQIGALVLVGLTDPLNGCDQAVRMAPFTFTAAQQNPPTIEFVDSTVEVPVTQTPHPAINVAGGADRLLVIGSGFDQMTFFDITKDQTNPVRTSGVVVLTPNLAVMTAPASPDDRIGLADLIAHNDFGQSDAFTVEYVQTPPPIIIDVRNLNDGTTTAPIDANDRILIFGDYFVKPGLVVTLKQGSKEVSFTDDELALIDDHIIGLTIPPDTFTKGPLEILVETRFSPNGVPTAFVDDGGSEIFTLSGPRPPLVTGVHPRIFHSHGGQDVILFGRNFTSTTTFRVKTPSMTGFLSVLAKNYLSETVVIVVMPEFPFAGDGSVEATETNGTLCDKLVAAGEPCVTVSPQDLDPPVSEPLYTVLADAAPTLLSVYADHGSTKGGEQVLLLGADFKNEIGENNVTGVRIGTFNFIEADAFELPLNSLDAADHGKYVVINDHQIMLITPVHLAIASGDFVEEDVVVDSDLGATSLINGYTWQDDAADICPVLLGITPNEGRISGGSSHLISGAFLTGPTTKVFLVDSNDSNNEVEITSFGLVNEQFLVFKLPDLRGSFSTGDKLNVRVIKTTAGGPCEDILNNALTLSFAGPPAITPTITPSSGSAFGGTLVKIDGSNFTPNTQVLFGTMPAAHVIFITPTLVYAVSPQLPLDVTTFEAGEPELDLLNVGGKSSADRTVDVVVFTQGGWSVVPERFRFEKEAPSVSALTVTSVLEGSSTDAITLFGERFLPGNTTLNVVGGGAATVINLTGGSITFRYTAPTPAAGTPGPLAIRFSVTTSHGTSAETTIDVVLRPQITSIAREGGGSLVMPTTGVETGGFTVFQATGVNFASGSAMTTITHGGDSIHLTEDAALDGPGQFKIIGATTIEFTVPVAFDENVPTILTGNPNIGLTTMDFRNANGLGIDSPASSFLYTPSHLDFEQEAFSIPAEAPNNSNPDKVAVDDINQDGVPDAACLNRAPNDGNTIDGFVFLANTFGSFDFNGDGETPDFEGSFTKFIIDVDDYKPNLYIYGRGGTVRFAQLDGDEPLELILPVITVDDTLDNRARVMVIDVESDGSLGAVVILEPDVTFSEGVAGIATGTFDNSDGRDDIAIIIGSPTEAHRDMVVFTSSDADATFGAFKQFTVDLTGVLDDESVGSLNAGDLDGDGDDDLVWGYHRKGGFSHDKFPIALVEVDADASPSVVAGDIKTIANLTAGAIRDIKIGDLDGDTGLGLDDGALPHLDIVLMAENGARPIGPDPMIDGIVGLDPVEGGIVVLLNVLDDVTPVADGYYQTGFDNNGRSLGIADFNAEGPMDIVASDSLGEFLIFWNDGDGVMERSGKSFQLNTVPGAAESRIHGIGAADINRDGMAEVWMGDIGSAPTSLVIMTNVSR